ncbi:hypothetical protein [Synechocystis salina]|uniref:DUF4314 domain-containing protein n=1 Tax=Synechocystis salina LEGE 00031 TaxID=1828736 RepID=A0ABR9VR09_9SYNC|nr:hypothetical protein [Synechocystis salina]MBE9240576.1 hypothetical protein [Synechocystis salina LEGE 00041]MBE9253780.1 hypothetical protein [Synechocystis salina LEGE 00031]
MRNDDPLGRRNGQEFEVVGLENGQVMIRWERGELRSASPLRLRLRHSHWISSRSGKQTRLY